MSLILRDVFNNKELAEILAFKGGSALMFFHGLSRFSTDLDLNLLDKSKTELVFGKMHGILSKYGLIDDEANKLYGPIFVLNYGKGERMLKVEISNRSFDNHYEPLFLSSTKINVMTMPDMFAHKLCAVGERLASRDIFDIFFFLKKGISINPFIIKSRTGKTVSEYCLFCANHVRNVDSRILMQGLGEVLNDENDKMFVKDRLLFDTALLLEQFSSFPLISEQLPTERTVLLEANPEFVEYVVENDIDISTMNETIISDILVNHKTLNIRNRYGFSIECGPYSFRKNFVSLKL